MSHATHYQSTKGPVLISTMPRPHALAAAEKLKRDTPERAFEIDGLMAHVATLDAAYQASQEAAPPVGHNNPPVLTGFEAYEAHIKDLLAEAQHFLNGDGVQSPADAEAVGKLMTMLKTTQKDADKARAEEKRPHDEAAKAVQAKWKPIIDRADMATDLCKKALTPWLQKLERERVAAADAARAQADARAKEAREALEAANFAADLEARQAAEAKIKEAAKAEKSADKIETATVRLETGASRATTLRSYYSARMIDRKAALMHYLVEKPDEVTRFLQSLADADVKAGRRVIQGFEISEERRVA
jgi:hypothetical protein